MVKTASRPADERTLLLLGLLHAQDHYGYELHDFIENNLHSVTDLKRATAYQLLTRLERYGDVHSRTEQHGQRPTRTVYALTTQGRAYFQQLLRQYLKQADLPRPPGNIALLFLEHLSPAELLPSLRAHRAALEAQVNTYRDMPPHPHAIGAGLAIARTSALLQADLEWFTQAIRQLERELPEGRVADQPG